MRVKPMKKMEKAQYLNVTHAYLFCTGTKRKKESLLLLWSMTVCFLVLNIFAFFCFTSRLSSSLSSRKPVRRPAPEGSGAHTTGCGQALIAVASGTRS